MAAGGVAAYFGAGALIAGYGYSTTVATSVKFLSAVTGAGSVSCFARFCCVSRNRNTMFGNAPEQVSLEEAQPGLTVVPPPSASMA